MIEAVIFDLDGVIIESEQVWDQVRRRFTKAHGGSWHRDSSRHMMGLSTREWVRYLTTDLGVKLTDEEVANQVIDEMTREYNHSLPLVPGATAAVWQLASSWPLAIASGSPLLLIDAVVDGASLRAAFQVLLSSDEVASGKPEPDVYLEGARRLNVNPERCAVVEDSSNGIRSAAAAGAAIVAIPNRMSPPDESVLAMADLVLADIHQLTPHVISMLSVKARDR